MVYHYFLIILVFPMKMTAVSRPTILHQSQQVSEMHYVNLFCKFILQIHLTNFLQQPCNIII